MAFGLSELCRNNLLSFMAFSNYASQLLAVMAFDLGEATNPSWEALQLLTIVVR
jgi:Mn2+/Fe2+ NRAMP family transporter